MKTALTYGIFLIAGVCIMLVIIGIGGCAMTPEYPFITSQSTPVKITLTRREDAPEVCSKRLKIPNLVACAFWIVYECEIIMTPDADNDTLGHEVRHCFDGSWH